MEMNKVCVHILMAKHKFRCDMDIEMMDVDYENSMVLFLFR